MSTNPSDASTIASIVGEFSPRRRSPARKLDWRFALALAQDRPQSARGALPTAPVDECPDDEFVIGMRQFLRRYRPSPPAARRRLETVFPGPYGALELRENISAELQLALQCRILAGESDVEIAQKTALSPLAIDSYEKCFFNVRDQLGAPDWIRANVLHADCLENLSPLEGALKRAAYSYGPAVLDVLLSGVPKPGLDDSLNAAETMEETVLNGFWGRAMLALLDSANAPTQELAALVRQMQAVVAGKRELQGDVAEREEIVTNAVRETIKKIHYITGEMGEEYLRKHCPDLLEYDSYAQELRDDEVWQVVAGKGAQFAHRKDKKMPPPPAREPRPLPRDLDSLEDN